VHGAICLELADNSTMPLERTGLEIMANNYRVEISDRELANRFADTVQKIGVFAYAMDFIW
jgi:hypothetical protein